MKIPINITAIILAGGLGTRLRPVVKDRPKVLSEVGGRSFLTYLLDQIIPSGIRDVILCTGYRAEQIPASLGHRYKTLDLTYSEESRPLGTCGAVRNALPLVTSEYILVMNGDSYADIQMGHYLKWFFRLDREASIVLTRVSNTDRYGKIEILPDLQLQKFTEKGNGHGPGWINAGIYIIKKSLLETLPRHVPLSMEYDFFPKLIGNGLYGFPTHSAFIDIGTPETYQAAENFFHGIVAPTDMKRSNHA